MRKSIGFILILAAVLSGAAFGQTQRSSPRGRESPPPTPTQSQAQPPRSQEPATSDQRGTDQSPLSVKIVQPPKSEAEAAQEQRDRDERRANESWFAALTRALAVATGGLLIATVGLWYTAARQSRALKGAVETARRSADSAEFIVKNMEATAERQQRAYVFVKQIDVQSEPQADRHARRAVRIMLENTGATATRHMVTSVSWAQFQPDLPNDFHFPDGKQEPALLGPRQTMEMRIADIPADVFTNAEQGSHKLYVWGWAEYNDVFANTQRHRTEFCFRLLVRGDPATDQCSFSTSPHGKYNAADDDCSKKPSRHLIQ
jgi:hypothetical protein